MIAIGKIVGSVGVRGACKVALLTDIEKRLEGLATVWVGRTDTASEERGIESVRGHRAGAVVKIKGIDSRTAAEKMRGAFLYVADGEGVRPPNGSYFVHEIVGLQVWTDEGREVGVVRDVIALPGGDAWLVSMNGREIMIPAVRAFITSVDLDGKRITIHAIEGLLDQ